MQWEAVVINSLLALNEKMREEGDGFQMHVHFERRKVVCA
jgi:hypothetical protein